MGPRIVILALRHGLPWLLLLQSTERVRQYLNGMGKSVAGFRASESQRPSFPLICVVVEIERSRLSHDGSIITKDRSHTFSAKRQSHSTICSEDFDNNDLKIFIHR